MTTNSPPSTHVGLGQHRHPSPKQNHQVSTPSLPCEIKPTQAWIESIVKVFPDEEITTNVRIGCYCIDVLFPAHNLAIDLCPSPKPNKLDTDAETTRREYLEENFEGRILHSYYDLPGSDIFGVLMRVHRCIVKARVAAEITAFKNRLAASSGLTQ